ncbi:MAG: hypothetical protein NVS1B6_14400 [Steroidobacteraceae bacterium]
MRRSKHRFKTVLRKCKFNPRTEVASVCFVISVLKLASATLGKVAARRVLMVRSKSQRSVVKQGVARNTIRHMTAA